MNKRQNKTKRKHGSINTNLIGWGEVKACFWHTQEHCVPIQLDRTKSNNVNKLKSNKANTEKPGWEEIEVPVTDKWQVLISTPVSKLYVFYVLFFCNNKESFKKYFNPRLPEGCVFFSFTLMSYYLHKNVSKTLIICHNLLLPYSRNWAALYKKHHKLCTLLG